MTNSEDGYSDIIVRLKAASKAFKRAKRVENAMMLDAARVAMREASEELGEKYLPVLFSLAYDNRWSGGLKDEYTQDPVIEYRDKQEPPVCSRVNTAWIEIVEGIETFDEGQPFEPWANTVALNSWRGKGRKEKRETGKTSEQEIDDEVTADLIGSTSDEQPDEVIDEQTLQEWREAVERVAQVPKLGEVIMVMQSAHLKNEDIARILGITVKEVRNRRQRIRNRARKYLLQKEQKRDIERRKAERR